MDLRLLLSVINYTHSFEGKRSVIDVVFLSFDVFYLKLAGFYSSNCMLPCHVKLLPANVCMLSCHTKVLPTNTCVLTCNSDEVNLML